MKGLSRRRALLEPIGTGVPSAGECMRAHLGKSLGYVLMVAIGIAGIVSLVGIAIFINGR